MLKWTILAAMVIVPLAVAIGAFLLVAGVTLTLDMIEFIKAEDWKGAYKKALLAVLCFWGLTKSEPIFKFKWKWSSR